MNGHNRGSNVDRCVPHHLGTLMWKDALAARIRRRVAARDSWRRGRPVDAAGNAHVNQAASVVEHHRRAGEGEHVF